MSQSFRTALVAAAVILIAVPAPAANVVNNPGFSQAGQLDGWTAPAGAVWASDDAGAAADSGSVAIEFHAIDSVTISQCVPVVENTVYDFGVDAKVEVVNQAGGKAGILVRSFSDGACTTPLSGLVDGTSINPVAFTDWTTLRGQLVTKAGEASALIELRGSKTAGNPGATYTVRLDNALLQSSDAGPACSDPQIPFGAVTTGDALFVLRASVGALECDLCVCDLNNSGQTTSSDALAVLRKAVGIEVALDCPSCS